MIRHDHYGYDQDYEDTRYCRAWVLLDVSDLPCIARHCRTRRPKAERRTLPTFGYSQWSLHRELLTEGNGEATCADHPDNDDEQLETASGMLDDAMGL
jgi:hypothetical protein